MTSKFRAVQFWVHWKKITTKAIRHTSLLNVTLCIHILHTFTGIFLWPINMSSQQTGHFERKIHKTEVDVHTTHISNIRKLKANFCGREKEGHFHSKNFLRALK